MENFVDGQKVRYTISRFYDNGKPWVVAGENIVQGYTCVTKPDPRYLEEFVENTPTVKRTSKSTTKSSYDPTSCPGVLCGEFREYHKDNPALYEKFKSLAFQVLDAGFNKYSMEGLYQQVRWHYSVEIKQGSTGWMDVKMSDHHRARYARLLMKLEPKLKNFFDTVENSGDGYC